MDMRLTAEEARALVGYDATGKIGGFQCLLLKLQDQFDPSSMTVVLEDVDLDRIEKYSTIAKGRGGWQKRIRAIFGRLIGGE